MTGGQDDRYACFLQQGIRDHRVERCPVANSDTVLAKTSAAAWANTSELFRESNQSQLLMHLFPALLNVASQPFCGLHHGVTIHSVQTNSLLVDPVQLRVVPNDPPVFFCCCFQQWFCFFTSGFIKAIGLSPILSNLTNIRHTPQGG